MPGPAVYAVVAVVVTVGVAVAFKEFVYEPHIAPRVEAWAENYIENRQRRRQRQAPILAQPVDEHGDENSMRRSSDSSVDPMDGRGVNGSSIELEQLGGEGNVWRDSTDRTGLRHRRPGGALDESDTFIAHPIMEPTHVLFDGSEPPSPGGLSIRTSVPSSLDNSPAHPAIVLDVARSPFPRAQSPRLPTPMSLYSSPSSPATMSTSTLSERSSLPSRRPSPALGASQALTSAYNTPLGGSMVSDNGRDASDAAPSLSGSRVQSPFSDLYEVETHSSPEHIWAGSPRARSPSIASDVTLDSDDEFDMLSPRSGMFSPSSRADEDLFDVTSQHGSEVSWTGVGRSRSPVDF